MKKIFLLFVSCLFFVGCFSTGTTAGIPPSKKFCMHETLEKVIQWSTTIDDLDGSQPDIILKYPI